MSAFIRSQLLFDVVGLAKPAYTREQVAGIPSLPDIRRTYVPSLHANQGAMREMPSRAIALKRDREWGSYQAPFARLQAAHSACRFRLIGASASDRLHMVDVLGRTAAEGRIRAFWRQQA